MRKRNNRHYSIYIAWILLLLCLITGLKSGLEKNAAGKKESYPGISIQSRWEELWKTVSSKDREEESESKDKTPEKDADPQRNIRILIMTDGYQQIVHREVEISAAGGLRIEKKDGLEETAGNEKIKITKEDTGFQNGKIRIQAIDGGEITVRSIRRGYGNPSYAGALDLYATSEGVVMVNELPLENYLCKVVPSEMPASYQKEALKAQAICARSYAYRQIMDYAYPEYQAHVNDSTDYQVYNNSASQQAATEAVQETAGKVLKYNGNIITAYYYSTSCGKTTTMAAWGTKEKAENAYLQSVEVKDENGDYERNLPWYRWEAKIQAKTLSNLIGLNTGKDIGTLQNINILENGPGGVVLAIEAVGDKGSVRVSTENKIRRALGGKGYTIIKQDGTKVKSSKLLPSAFFTINKSGDTFVIKGGGFGHGIGMSQTGANEMAKCGKNYQEILTFFYQGVTIG